MTTILVLNLNLEDSSSPYEYIGKGKVRKGDGDLAKTMTVGQLKAILNSHPDDAEIWMGGSLDVGQLGQIIAIETVTVEEDGAEVKSAAEAFCANCGWKGPESELLDDIYDEGEGHMYCPECELSTT